MLSQSFAVINALEEGKCPWEMLAGLLNRDVDEVKAQFQAPEEDIWRLLYRLASAADGLRAKKPREYYTDLDRIIDLIDKSHNIVILLGAGGSVGPDFRSPGGLYDSIAKDGVFDDPCKVFDNQYFEEDPSIFWRYAHTIFPSANPQHSGSHIFIEMLEQKGKLLRVYSQNVDTLEKGIPDEKLVCVHGSWRECRCMQCGLVQSIEDLRPSVEQRVVPQCKQCGGPIKPGIVFFEQPTNLDEKQAFADAEQADLLIVIGTSLRVAPISELPDLMSSVPSILINRAPVTTNFNAQFLGECDDIVQMLESELGWIENKRISSKDSVFFPPNNFVIESNSELGTRIIETSRNKFLATSFTIDVSDTE
ncbi:NAD+ binding [Trichomonas vaginalis G3]|nr:NAD+ binding [Trichomonas vaginalis G3]KAI5488559.1 NAD+ binding [Trichomonas vaginalis G3]